MKRKICCIGIVLSCCLFVGCSTEEAEKEEETLQKEETLSRTVQENREGELVFSFSLREYMNHYNQMYQEEYGEEYLGSLSDWYVVTLPKGIHADQKTLRYDFISNEEIWSMPTISVYVPVNSDTVQEITVNFDDHSYTDEVYAQYETMCFYALQILFPDMEKEDIVALYKNIIRLAHENVVPNEEGYGNGAIPCVIYEKDGVGIYPYFAIGESLHLCIIPVTEESLIEWQEKGVEVIAVE